MSKYTIGPDVDLDEEEIYTPSGHRLTDAVADEIAGDALRQVRAGRPSLTGPGQHSPQVSARVPPELHDQAEQQARREGIRLSQLIRKALELYLSGRSPAGR